MLFFNDFHCQVLRFSVCKFFLCFRFLLDLFQNSAEKLIVKIVFKVIKFFHIIAFIAVVFIFNADFLFAPNLVCINISELLHFFVLPVFLLFLAMM